MSDQAIERLNRLEAIETRLQAMHVALWDRTTAALNGNMWNRYMRLSGRCNALSKRHARVWDAIFACFQKGGAS